jgi:hypothetical protein
MAMTLREALRLEIGDTGTFVRDVYSGTGAKSVFWLGGSPIRTSTLSAYVGDAAATATATVEGRVSFATAPASGTDNVEVTYHVVQLTDEQVDELLRQHGYLTPTADVPVPTEPEFLRTAAHGCDTIAALLAGGGDVTMDGTSISRAGLASNYAERAAAIRERLAREFSGITSAKIRRIDGYSRVRDVTVDESGANSENVRRNFYGEQDMIP